jgi:hypothetical protein
MPHYVDASAQTLIEGLTHNPIAHPSALLPPTNTTTPPDDMAIDKLHLDTTPSITKTNMETLTSPTLLLRRKKRPPMVARISMPESVFGNVKFDVENPASPPPTETVLSPLPAANRLHAGHTPSIPRARSPLDRDESDPPTPIEDEALRGPLFLPPQPGDGTEDTIPLNALDAELEKVRLEQEKEDAEESVPPPPMPTNKGSTHGPDPSQFQPAAKPTEPPLYDPVPGNWNNSEDIRRSSDCSGDTRRSSDNSEKVRRSSDYSSGTRRSSADEVDVVDGVILKKPKMNLGAPLGQA